MPIKAERIFVSLGFMVQGGHGPFRGLDAPFLRCGIIGRRGKNYNPQIPQIMRMMNKN